MSEATWIIWLVIFASSIWAGVDAFGYLKIYPGTRGPANTTPLAWFFGVLLLWIILFPVYLIFRRRPPTVTTQAINPQTAPAPFLHEGVWWMRDASGQLWWHNGEQWEKFTPVNPP